MIELVTYNDFKLNRNKEIDVIEGLKLEHIQPLGVDLTVGQEYFNLTTGERRPLDKNTEFSINHGDFIIVWTEEILHVPNNWFGFLASKVSLVSQGFTHFGTKVDPGFEGKLKLSFRNDGHRQIKLKRGEPICNIIFFRLDRDTGIAYKRQVPEPMTLETPLSFRYRLSEADIEKLKRQHSREFIDFYLAFWDWIDQKDKMFKDMTERVDWLLKGVVIALILALLSFVFAAGWKLFMELK